MKIICNHGYFKVYQDAIGEVARFNSRFNFDLTFKDDYFTFAGTLDVPDYSILGRPILGNVAIKTCEDFRPWEVMRKNGLVYNHTLKTVVPIASITDVIGANQTSLAYSSSKNLYMPGSYDNDWSQITGYLCSLDFSLFTFYYTEFYYD